MSSQLAYLKRYALYLLGRRAHSRREMETKLQRKMTFAKKRASLASDEVDATLPEDLIKHVMEYLDSLQLLDDTTFAKNYAESLATRGKSSRVIAGKLRQKGFSSDLIKESISTDSDQDAKALADTLLSLKMRKPTLFTTREGKMKGMRFLMNRGFAYSDICKALNEVTDE